MIKLSPFCIRVLFSAVLLTALVHVPAVGKTVQEKNEFSAIIEQLVKDGFDREKIQAIYANPQVKFKTDGVYLFYSKFTKAEKKRNYSGFYTKEAIGRAAAYTRTHDNALNQAQKKYGVPPGIITGILLVETQLGTFPMKHLAINMLSSIAALSDEKLQDRVWNRIPKKWKPEKKSFIERANKKTDWAYRELKALITYLEKDNLSPDKVKGSYAGAVGYCQFMPTNIKSLARDGNNDGRIDLLNHDDAIFSIAHYLKRHGWKKKLTRERQKEIIHTYNHDKIYAETILIIAEKVSQRSKRK